ncbi:hypothetical protein [Kitasatospora sp. NPDC050543]|uniref:hypothetical protein n=1 Tax=Kitasatospora sp. NPDC050543 TaxID=3364054 RepID=UPI00379BF106
MRSARTLLTGAVLAAAVAVGAPLAFADGSTDQGKNLTWEEKQDKAATTDTSKDWSEKTEKSDTSEKAEKKDDSSSYSKEKEEKAPHGGVHTGGGGLALSGGGLASGAVLLLGGLGAGAFALRRRKAPVGVAV